MHSIAQGMAAAGLIFSICAAAYSLLTLVAVACARARRQSTGAAHPVTVLKPLCGAEERLYESLRSFCLQDHPAYEIIFGVRSREDAAVPVVSLLQREFPHLTLKLVVSAAEHGRNPKVSNLLNMLPSARHARLVIADSDIEVPADYLRRVCAPLAKPSVGIVTCAYLGVPATRLASRLAAEFINGWFMPSVYLAALFGSRAFAFGSTLAMRREVLEEIGGFHAIADELADDYKLGEATRRLGYATVLSEVVVGTCVAERSLLESIDHQLRWLRTIRALRPRGYALAGISFAGPVALLGLLLHPTSGTSAVLVLCLAGRCAFQFLAPNPGGRRFEWWLPCVSEFLTGALWCVSFFSRRVLWRGVAFNIAPDGTVRRAEPARRPLAQRPPAASGRNPRLEC